jgi:hypothetical protein
MRRPAYPCEGTPGQSIEDIYPATQSNQVRASEGQSTYARASPHKRGTVYSCQGQSTQARNSLPMPGPVHTSEEQSTHARCKLALACPRMGRLALTWEDWLPHGRLALALIW